MGATPFYVWGLSGRYVSACRRHALSKQINRTPLIIILLLLYTPFLSKAYRCNFVIFVHPCCKSTCGVKPKSVYINPKRLTFEQRRKRCYIAHLTPPVSKNIGIKAIAKVFAVHCTLHCILLFRIWAIIIEPPQ